MKGGMLTHRLAPLASVLTSGWASHLAPSCSSNVPLPTRENDCWWLFGWRSALAAAPARITKIQQERMVSGRAPPKVVSGMTSQAIGPGLCFELPNDARERLCNRRRPARRAHDFAEREKDGVHGPCHLARKTRT